MLIGKRQEVGVREVWPLETSFSDWLASDEGLELIASDIGVEIENPHRERRDGDFRCDIMGNALGEESHVVVIENQYNKTDHDHLGKMLTYAAVHSATTGIWISERVSDDHRQVIDWLNSVTPPNVNFYLAQIKLFRIGDSAVAPELDVVCQPNTETKRQRQVTQSSVSEGGQWRKAFWEDVSAYIKEQKPSFNVRKPSDTHYSRIRLNHHFSVFLALESKNTRACCQLYFNPPSRLLAFDQLLAQREDIEREIGVGLEWQASPEKKSSRIKLYADINPQDPAQRDAIKAWMHKYSVAFYKAFRPRVQSLTANVVEADTDEEFDADNN